MAKPTIKPEELERLFAKFLRSKGVGNAATLIAMIKSVTLKKFNSKDLPKAKEGLKLHTKHVETRIAVFGSADVPELTQENVDKCITRWRWVNMYTFIEFEGIFEEIWPKLTPFLDVCRERMAKKERIPLPIRQD